ncbi:MAG: toll/interleukin-1 receptor domain-containing protein [Bacteroidota bacterium]
MSNNRTEVRFFLSYAHENLTLASKFKKLIVSQLGPSLKYKYKIWRDEDDLLPGQSWSNEIKKALDDCDLGLLLVTPSFLNSSFITNQELPIFNGEKGKPYIPIMLSNINLKRHNLKGLDSSQIFRFRTSQGNLKDFSNCNTRQRNEFCEILFEKIESRLDSLGL